MECENAMQQIKLLQEEGFGKEQIERLMPKLEAVAALTPEERRELKERMELLLPERKADTVLSEGEKSFQRMYAGFGGAVSELLRQNNEALLEQMDERVSKKIMKEMNYLFRERENLEEERYRKLDRTIRECQAARQRTAIEEERKKRRFGFL